MSVLRLAPIRGEVARERRRARRERLESGPPSTLSRRRGCECGWPGALLVVDGLDICPACGSSTVGEGTCE